MTDKRAQFIEKIKRVAENDRAALSKSSIWFVGVEPGSEETPESIRQWLEKKTLDNPPHLFSKEFKNKYNDPKTGWHTWKLHQKIAKVLMAYKTGDIDGWMDYRKNGIYNDGLAYQINLFPICFPNIKVCEEEYRWIFDDIGVSSKREYFETCAENTFPLFEKNFRRISPPKMIICFGKSMTHYFLKAFPCSSDMKPEFTTELGSTGKKVAEYKMNDTTVLVTPHFSGAHGLNSDESLIELGKLMSAIWQKIN